MFSKITLLPPTAAGILVVRDGPVECEHGVPRDDNDLNNTRRRQNPSLSPRGPAAVSGAGVPSRRTETGYAAHDGNKS